MHAKAPTPHGYRLLWHAHLDSRPPSSPSTSSACSSFALSGGLVAVKKRFDLFGVLVLACAAALGGGIVRDLLIGDIPPVGISDWRLLTAAALGGLVTFLFHPGVERITRFVRVLDAAGLGAFAVAGSLKAVTTPGVSPVAAVLVGVITAVGGGVVRDVLAGQVPEVLRRELYAVPAMLGSVVVVARRPARIPARTGCCGPRPGSSSPCGCSRCASTSTPPRPCAPSHVARAAERRATTLTLTTTDGGDMTPDAAPTPEPTRRSAHRSSPTTPCSCCASVAPRVPTRSCPSCDASPPAAASRTSGSRPSASTTTTSVAAARSTTRTVPSSPRCAPSSTPVASTRRSSGATATVTPFIDDALRESHAAGHRSGSSR